MNEHSDQTHRANIWLLNTSLFICLIGMTWIASLTPEFGAMYEGLGSQLPLLTRLVYHPSIYWGAPSLLLIFCLAANLLPRRLRDWKDLALKVTLLVSHLYLALSVAGLYWPIHLMKAVLHHSS